MCGSFDLWGIGLWRKTLEELICGFFDMAPKIPATQFLRFYASMRVPTNATSLHGDSSLHRHHALTD